MSSDSVLCTSAMFAKPVRPSRISLPYMCITMSLSSEWITPRPPFAAQHLEHFPDVAEIHHAPLAATA